MSNPEQNSINRLVCFWGAIAAIFSITAIPSAASAQEVTSQFVSVSEDEQALKQELVVPVDVATAWAWFTVPENIEQWMAPVADVDLRTGGAIRTNYDVCKFIGGEGTITLNIVNFVPGEMLTLQSSLDSAREAKWMNDAIWERRDRLYNVITFADAGEGKTLITSWGLGYGTGTEWQTMLGFFVTGNEWTFGNLTKAIGGEKTFDGECEIPAVE